MNVIVDESVTRFIKTLEKNSQAKTLRVLELLEEYRSKLGMPHSKALGEGLFELRVRGKQEARLLYGFRRDSVIIAHGFVKKTQRIPIKELIYARKSLSVYDI